MANPLFNGDTRGIANLVAAKAAHEARQPRLEIKEDHKLPQHKWRWRIFMSSDEVAASTQGDATESLCKENLKSIGKYIATLEQSGKI